VLQQWAVVFPSPISYYPHVQRLSHDDMGTYTFAEKIASTPAYAKEITGKLAVYYDSSTYPLYEYLFTCVHEKNASGLGNNFVELHWLYFKEGVRTDQKAFQISPYSHCVGIHAISSTSSKMLLRTGTLDVYLYSLDFSADTYSRERAAVKMNNLHVDDTVQRLNAQFIDVDGTYSQFYLFGLTKALEGNTQLGAPALIGFVLNSDDTTRLNPFFDANPPQTGSLTATLVSK